MTDAELRSLKPEELLRHLLRMVNYALDAVMFGHPVAVSKTDKKDWLMTDRPLMALGDFVIYARDKAPNAMREKYKNN